MATGKLEAIGYIFIWATSYLTISIKIAYFPLGLPENFLKKSFRKPPSKRFYIAASIKGYEWRLEETHSQDNDNSPEEVIGCRTVL